METQIENPHSALAGIGEGVFRRLKTSKEMVTNPAQTCNTSGITPQVVVNARLADQMGAVAGLYYLARYFDSFEFTGSRRYSGSGWATFPAAIAEHYLDRSKSTIHRLVYEGKQKGYFLNANVKKGYIRIRYKAELKIFAEMGINDAGAFGRIPLDHLGSIRIAATEIQAEGLQRASIDAAQKAYKGKKRVMPLGVLFGDEEQDDCQNRDGESHILYRFGERTTGVSEDFLLFGASQATIGKYLGRSERTVQRRLSNRYRAARGLRSVTKTQLAKRFDLVPRNWQQEADNFAAEGRDKLSKAVKRLFNFTHMVEGELTKEVFGFYCNVYQLDAELCRKRFKKRRIFKLFEKRSVVCEAL